jgi:hypothetical protein
MRALFLSLLLTFAATAHARPLTAGETERNITIPTAELEFVETIKTVDKAQILEQLGEPALRDDIVGPDGEVIAAVWHYRYLNTDQNGTYYKTTELDFVYDKVVMVVFMNHDVLDGKEIQRDEPAAEPELDPSQDPDLLDEIEPEPSPGIPQYNI